MEKFNGIIGQGDILRRFFDPQLVLGADAHPMAKQQIKHLIKGATQRLRFLRPDLVSNTNGRFQFTQETAHAFQQAGYAAAGLINQYQDVRVPESSHDIEAIGRLLVDSALNHNGEVTCVFPVCPDYASDRRSIRRGISAEADAGIRGAKAFVKALKAAGYSPHAIILVADTEDDKTEILERSAQGDGNFYKNQCQASVIAIQKRIATTPEISSTTFSEYLSEAFRETQYRIEDELRIRDTLQPVIEDIGEGRRKKHALILGREESGYELTIRYIAQYAALGEILRRRQEIFLIANYPTPNRRFVNTPTISPISEYERVPVLGTVVRKTS